jgi:hypothetical protein
LSAQQYAAGGNRHYFAKKGSSKHFLSVFR